MFRMVQRRDCISSTYKYEVARAPFYLSLQVGEEVACFLVHALRATRSCVWMLSLACHDRIAGSGKRTTSRQLSKV
jgi:hypothetical protein